MATDTAISAGNVWPRDGYELWLDYRPVQSAERSGAYRKCLQGVAVPGDSPTVAAVRAELQRLEDRQEESLESIRTEGQEQFLQLARLLSRGLHGLFRQDDPRFHREQQQADDDHQ